MNEPSVSHPVTSQTGAEPTGPSSVSSTRSSGAYAFAVIGTFLLVAMLVWFMRGRTTPPTVDQNRIAERAKALADLRAAEAEALNHAGWIDQGKGVARLPIHVAMDLVVRKWQDPAAARADLLERVAKANAQPPKPPEKPSEFE